MREVWAFLPYVWRTARRARMRTWLAVLGAALAMGLFAFVRTVDEGVARFHENAERPVLVVFQDSRFCPTTSLMPLRYASVIREVPGVEAVLPTLIHLNSCQANLDQITLHGIEADALEAVHEFDVDEGSVADWRSRTDGALIGRALAARRGAKVGERLRLENVDVHVSGIVHGTGPGFDNLALVHLDQLALARKRQGVVTEFLVRLAPGASPPVVAEAIDARFRSDEAPTDTQSMQAFVAGAVGEIGELIGFLRGLGYLAVIVVGLVLANTVYISAQTRAAELGVLETIGVTKSRLAGLIVIEGILLGVVGGAVGGAVVLSLFAVFPVTLGIESFGIGFFPSWAVGLQTAGASLAVGLLAALGPAVAAVRRPLHDAVRGEE
jgi:putative ABC transport system permease protein